jgi:hypothetical protein
LGGAGRAWPPLPAAGPEDPVPAGVRAGSTPSAAGLDVARIVRGSSEDAVEIRDASDRVLRTLRTPWELQHALLEDLDGDGDAELIVGPRDGDRAAGRLIILSAETGDSLAALDTRTGAQHVIEELRARGEPMTDHFRVGHVRVAVETDGTRLICVSAFDPIAYLTRVLVLDGAALTSGRDDPEMTLLDFWHKGSVNELVPIDLEDDGQMELLVLAVANDLRRSLRCSPAEYPPTAICLGIGDADGAPGPFQSFPGTIPTIPVRCPIWQVVIPQPMTGFRVPPEGGWLDRSPRGATGQSDVRLMTVDMRYYYVGRDGSCPRIVAGDEWQSAHPDALPARLHAIRCTERPDAAPSWEVTPRFPGD